MFANQGSNQIFYQGQDFKELSVLQKIKLLSPDSEFGAHSQSICSCSHHNIQSAIF